MQHDISTTEQLEAISAKLGESNRLAMQVLSQLACADAALDQMLADERARQVELSLINHNPSVDRVLEACKRIQWSWRAKKEGDTNESV